MKRGLSGIYIFEKGEPTAFEDCADKTQDEWLETLDVREKEASGAPKADIGCLLMAVLLFLSVLLALML